jgi:hypothetical protein
MTATSPVLIVDPATGLDAHGDGSDSIHPDASGQPNPNWSAARDSGRRPSVNGAESAAPSSRITELVEWAHAKLAP